MNFLLISSVSMLSEFLRTSKNGKPMRLAVFGPASTEVHRMIQMLWSMDHSIFSILPNRATYLTHFLAEGRFDGLVIPSSLSGSANEKAMSASRCLGIPALKFGMNHWKGNSPRPTHSRMMVEARLNGSSIPHITHVEPMQWETQIERNKKLLGNVPTVLPLSRNWLLDAESLNVAFHANTPSVTPNMVIIDPESVVDLVRDIAADRISVRNLERIVIDTPSPDEIVSALNPILLRQLRKLNLPVLVRYYSSELGPVGDLVPVDETLSDRTHVSVPALAAADETAPTRENIRRPGKRRIMAADWRVRKVPLAVYHKKRGFKGQIYYTTKHKGWTFYRSRYYN